MQAQKRLSQLKGIQSKGVNCIEPVQRLHVTISKYSLESIMPCSLQCAHFHSQERQFHYEHPYSKLKELEAPSLKCGDLVGAQVPVCTCTGNMDQRTVESHTHQCSGAGLVLEDSERKRLT